MENGAKKYFIFGGIFLAAVLLFAGGYFWYSGRQEELAKQKEIEASREKDKKMFSDFFQNLNSNITVLPPSGGSGGGTSSSSTQSPLTATTSPFSLPKIKAKASKEYLDVYSKIGAVLNKNAQTIQAIQKILNEISARYAKGESYFSLKDLIAQGEEQNKILLAQIGDLRNFLNNWSGINNGVSDAGLKSATANFIPAANNYAGALENFSKALAEVLAYKGVGDLNKLSLNLQNAAGQISEKGKEAGVLFQEINKILSQN